MILYKGIEYQNYKQEELLNSLYDDCLSTLSGGKRISSELVINACDALYKKLINHQFDDIVIPLLKTMNVSNQDYIKAIETISKEKLEEKVKIELGDLSNKAPLGILYHISAGNVDFLPAFSVVEGLLAGNINILKLPTGDTGVSIKLLECLIEEEPLLKDYIYVFDIPSIEIESMKKMAEFANAIVVWGGDEANKAVREYAPINTKIISWGHKLSFAYISEDCKDADLRKIANHVCVTNQVLCSSCQGIYIDTNDDEVLLNKAKIFFEIFKEEKRKVGGENLGMIGKNTFQLYSKSLEENNEDIDFNDEGVSVVVKKDSELELSYMFRNVWIKKLPKDKIVKTLHKHKNHLQTVALFVNETERELIKNILVSAGVTKITSLESNIDNSYESHDGEYPLLRYSKVIEDK